MEAIKWGDDDVIGQKRIGQKVWLHQQAAQGFHLSKCGNQISELHSIAIELSNINYWILDYCWISNVQQTLHMSLVFLQCVLVPLCVLVRDSRCCVAAISSSQSAACGYSAAGS